MEDGYKRDGKARANPMGGGSRKRGGKLKQASTPPPPAPPNKYSIYLLRHTLAITFQMEAGQDRCEDGARLMLLKGFLAVPL